MLYQDSIAMLKLSAFSRQKLVLFLLSYILCPPISTPPFSYISTNFTSLTLLFTFPKTLQTECSCSASRIGTLCFAIFFLRTLPTPQRLSRFCFSGCRLSCLKSRQTAASQNESKRWGSIPFHSILTSPSAFWRPNRCSLPGFYISLISCINYIIIIIIKYYITM